MDAWRTTRSVWGEALAPLAAAGRKHAAAVFGRHPLAEAVRALASAVVRLVCAFHGVLESGRAGRQPGRTNFYAAFAAARQTRAIEDYSPIRHSPSSKARVCEVLRMRGLQVTSIFDLRDAWRWALRALAGPSE